MALVIDVVRLQRGGFRAEPAAARRRTERDRCRPSSASRASRVCGSASMEPDAAARRRCLQCSTSRLLETARGARAGGRCDARGAWSRLLLEAAATSPRPGSGVNGSCGAAACAGRGCRRSSRRPPGCVAGLRFADGDAARRPRARRGLRWPAGFDEEPEPDAEHGVGERRPASATSTIATTGSRRRSGRSALRAFRKLVHGVTWATAGGRRSCEEPLPRPAGDVAPAGERRGWRRPVRPWPAGST